MAALMDFLKAYFVNHWTFLVIAFVIGVIVQIGKTKLFTHSAAARSRIVWIARAFLPLHGAIFGILGAVVMLIVFGEDGAPRGDGIDGPGQVVLYYVGAGIVAPWIHQAFKHFVRSRGIESPWGESAPPPTLR